jgi:hypothetical protein
MLLDNHLPTSADAAPFTYEARPAEEIWLNAHAVKSPHVAGWIDPPHLQVGREHLKLSDRVRHIVIQRALFHNIKWTRALPP